MWVHGVNGRHWDDPIQFPRDATLVCMARQNP